MLKQKYFLTGIFILSAERQPIKLAWRKIVWLQIISFLSIILVLYIHSSFHDYPHEIQGMLFNHYLQVTISQCLGQCAVPMFFAISGYLFFLGVKGVDDVWKKMNKRVWTILMPFLIAAWFLPLFYIVIENIPVAAIFMNGGGFTEQFTWKNWANIVEAVYIEAPYSPSPWGFHLWFMQDLIIIIIISPLLFYLRKALFLNKLAGVMILLFVSALSLSFIPLRSICWFMLGDLCLSKEGKSLNFKMDIGVIVFLFVILCICQASFVISNSVFTILTTACGLVALWKCYDLVVSSSFILKEHKWLLLACNYTFFIYLYHEPTLNIVRKLLVVPFGHNCLSFAISYLLSPWIFTIIWVGVGVCLKRMIPKVYGICVGGR
ncbi:acyltransferase family protein [Bacteroides xylanisolvens]|uniref:Peptidoglycan/LPS O-acetylase OafA/YrhL, contains acyltransferase and SGNH-hydrolase domains n=2 Tax=Bacteroidaceae TaxID=815 RepID=A0A1I4ZLK2_9BACE|nr:acyltransferase family protein [Bacteroides xylanisolvens]SFN51122.1 Peptidoglycan/LPS O-acetylase OafA/YrhL, contains acyltransferase and SGNH-hydrolase domains [Bacteroides xylanisolvens]